MGLETIALIAGIASAAFGTATGVQSLVSGGGEGGGAIGAPPRAFDTDLDRQEAQASETARQRLLARRRGEGRQTVLSLGQPSGGATIQRSVLGGTP